MTDEEKKKLDELKKKEADEAEPSDAERTAWIARNRRLDAEEKAAAEEATKKPAVKKRSFL